MFQGVPGLLQQMLENLFLANFMKQNFMKKNFLLLKISVMLKKLSTIFLNNLWVLSL